MKANPICLLRRSFSATGLSPCKHKVVPRVLVALAMAWLPCPGTFAQNEEKPVKDYAPAAKEMPAQKQPIHGEIGDDAVFPLEKAVKVQSREYGTPADFEEAAKCLRMGADHGQPVAQATLGWCFERGSGVAKDQTEAVRLYSKSAEKGIDLAQALPGRCYEFGTGVEKNEAEALKWYRLSAEQGHPRGQYSLGMAYSRGIGVPKNPVESAKWILYCIVSQNEKESYWDDSLSPNSSSCLSDWNSTSCHEGFWRSIHQP